MIIKLLVLYYQYDIQSDGVPPNGTTSSLTALSWQLPPSSPAKDTHLPLPVQVYVLLLHGTVAIIISKGSRVLMLKFAKTL